VLQELINASMVTQLSNTFRALCMEAESHSTASHPEPFLDNTDWDGNPDHEDPIGMFDNDVQDLRTMIKACK